MLGALAFFAPKLALGLFLFFGLMRLMFHRRCAMACCGGQHYYQHKMNFVDQIRNMSEEEYETLKTKMTHGRSACCNHKKEKCESKKSENK